MTKQWRVVGRTRKCLFKREISTMVSKECAKSRAWPFLFLTEEVKLRSRLRFFSKPTNNHKFKRQQYRWLTMSHRERSFMCWAVDRCGLVAWCDETHFGAHFHCNNNGAALASVSMNALGGQRTLTYPPSPSLLHFWGLRGPHRHTHHSVAYRSWHDHLERDTTIKMLQAHHVGGIQSTAGLRCRDVCPHCLPVHTAVDWHILCLVFEGNSASLQIISFLKIHWVRARQTSSSAGYARKAFL